MAVKELLTAKEAYVQFIFMYRPISERLIAYATKNGESDVVLARAMKALKQPGDSAPHNDHFHVRIYCPATDRMYGCVDIGPLELLAERETEAHDRAAMIARTITPVQSDDTGDGEADGTVADASAPLDRSAADVWAAESAGTSTAAVLPPTSGLQSLFTPVSTADRQ
jgi:hypothetical protein